MADRRDDELLEVAAAALRASPIATDESDTLAAATAALREVEPAAQPAVAATRGRVMASLERSGRGRKKRVVVAALLASFGTGTLSWAAATGRVSRAIESLTEARPAWPSLAWPALQPAAPMATKHHRGHAATAADSSAEPVAVAVVEPQPPQPVVEPQPVAEPQPVVEPQPTDAGFHTTTTPDLIPVPAGVAEPATQPALPPLPPPRIPRRDHRPAPAPTPVEPAVVDDAVDRDLYRRAHELHFHGTDPAAALAAWDQYLTERPAGQFAVEARYNRALALIRLGRRDDARAALAPFADGGVEPAGYRRRDARELLEALDRDPMPAVAP